jgi:hypothetical protein
VQRDHQDRRSDRLVGEHHALADESGTGEHRGRQGHECDHADRDRAGADQRGQQFGDRDAEQHADHHLNDPTAALDSRRAE